MTVKVKVSSPRFSMKGWDFWSFVKGNWKSIKELIKVGLPLFIGWSITHNPTSTGAITILGKAILDMGDYYFTKR